MPPPILLTNTTWWPCASRLAMSLTRSGCDVAAVCPTRGHPLLKTAAVLRTFPYRARQPLESLAAAMREFEPQLVVPCDDRAVQHLHELHAAPIHQDLSRLIERSLGAPASYPIVSNRLGTLEIAREEGLRVPETRAINSLADPNSLPGGKPPWVFKADGSWGGHGVRIAHSLLESEKAHSFLGQPLTAVRALKRLLVDRDAFWLRTWWQHSRTNVIAQSYIQGRPANCAVFCWEGKVLAAIHVEVVRAQGALGAATIVRVIHHQEMALAAERIAGRLGLSGFFGLDFVIEDRTGAAYLIEMNPRCTPLSHLRLGAGPSPVEALAAKLTGLAHPAEPPDTFKDTVAYFPQAWRRDRACTFLKSSFHDVPWEDPALVRELLRLPWPDRGILARISNRLRGLDPSGGSPAEDIFEPPQELRDQLVLLSEARPIFDEASGACSMRLPCVVPLRHTGEREPLFLIHGVDGAVTRFHKLVRHLDPRQPVYGVLSQALLGEPTAFTRIEDMAAHYLKEVRAVQPRGPYHLLGFSFGGLIAFEMARQMHFEGDQVGMVGMIDNRPMMPDASEIGLGRIDSAMAHHLARVVGPNGTSYAVAKLRARSLRYIYALLTALDLRIPGFLQDASDINWFAARAYTPRFYPGSLTLFQAMEAAGAVRPGDDRWLQLSGEGTELRGIPGFHENLFDEPQVQFLAKEISDCLARIQHPRHSKVHAGLEECTKSSYRTATVRER